MIYGWEPCMYLVRTHKAQGTVDHTGYFFAGYGYFPYPNVTGKVYKDPDIRKFNLYLTLHHSLDIEMP